MDMLKLDLSNEESNGNNETKLYTADTGKDADVDIISVKAEFQKYSTEEIIKASKEIDPKKVAAEVLVWLDVNLENYIDNYAKLFQIPLDDLDVGAGAKCDMTETKRLQSLYRGIQEDNDSNLDNVSACRRELDRVTEKCHEAMTENEELLSKLFDRMIFYYEFRGFSSDGKEIVQNFEGLVSILKFEYEAFSVGVTIREGLQGFQEEDYPEGRQVLKEYVIPEGFIVWVEIAMKKAERPRGIF